jgi:glutathione-regulated potassium-efflux system ancillary protein KefG
LLKQWIDLVLTFGWAYGPGGTALHGKAVCQVVTTGGPQQAYTAEGFHGSTLMEFLRPFQRTVTLCGMRHLPPYAVHGTHKLSDDELGTYGADYARLLVDLAEGRIIANDVTGAAYMNEVLTKTERP